MTDVDYDAIEDESDDEFDNDEPDKRAIAAFEKNVLRNIKVLISPRANREQRIEAAYWLGESAKPKAITALRKVYNRDKKDKKLHQAVAFALGQFKALDLAIEREEGDSVTEALYREENSDVLDLITTITMNGPTVSKPKPAFGLLNIGLLVVLVILVIVNVALVAVGSGDDESNVTATTAPTASPAAAIDDDSTPTPTSTATDTPTPTIEPTATLDPRELTRHLQIISTNIGDAMDGRAPHPLLVQYWNDVTRAGATAGCNAIRPTIPSDYTVPEDILLYYPDLEEITDKTNLGLQLLRDSWNVFENACREGELIDKAELELVRLDTAATWLNSARSQLDQLRNSQTSSP
jgi:hypothetical protein